MKTENKIIVGIDPDITKSGYAIYQNRKLSVEAFTFPELVEKLYSLSTLPDEVLVIVEAGWLNEKSNFHGHPGRRAERIAKNVGSNHQTGRHIIEMAKYFGLEVIEQRPLSKLWRGKNKKITQEELNYILKMNGIKEIKKTSQDCRDAALLALWHANLKIGVKV